MSKWIPGQGFYLVQPSKAIDHIQNKKNLEILELRLQAAERRLGIQNG